MPVCILELEPSCCLKDPASLCLSFPSSQKLVWTCPLSTNLFEKSAQMHIPSKAYYFSRFVDIRFKTAPATPLLVMNYS